MHYLSSYWTADICKGEFSGTCHLEVRVPWDDLCNSLSQPLIRPVTRIAGRGIRKRLLFGDYVAKVRVEIITSIVISTTITRA